MQPEVKKPENERMSLVEVAAYLEKKPGTIYHMTAKRTIPHYKEGETLVFLRSEINAWNNKRRKRVKTIIDSE